MHLGLTVATRLGLDVAYEGGAALVPVEPSAEGPVLGLSNLARTLSRYEEQRWPALVKKHFVQLLDCLRNGPPPPPKDPERELLQRLVPREALPTHWGEDRSDFVPGLMSVPATINDGTVTMYLEPPDLGLTWPEAERLGLANLRRLTDHVEYLDHDDIRIAFITGTPFAASPSSGPGYRPPRFPPPGPPPSPRPSSRRPRDLPPTPRHQRPLRHPRPRPPPQPRRPLPHPRPRPPIPRSPPGHPHPRGQPRPQPPPLHLAPSHHHLPRQHPPPPLPPPRIPNQTPSHPRTPTTPH